MSCYHINMLLENYDNRFTLWDNSSKNLKHFYNTSNGLIILNYTNLLL